MIKVAAVLLSKPNENDSYHYQNHYHLSENQILASNLNYFAYFFLVVIAFSPVLSNIS